MQDENKKANINGTNGNGTFLKDMGKSVASSALAGLILAVVSRGAMWVFPKLKI